MDEPGLFIVMLTQAGHRPVTNDLAKTGMKELTTAARERWPPYGRRKNG
jgi:hypothetical protein